MLLHLREDDARVKGSEAQCGNSNHDAVQDDKVGFILHDGVLPSTGHLSNTIAAAGEDGEEGQDESTSKELEAQGVQKGDSGGGEGTAAFVGAKSVVCD